MTPSFNFALCYAIVFVLVMDHLLFSLEACLQLKDWPFEGGFSQFYRQVICLHSV